MLCGSRYVLAIFPSLHELAEHPGGMISLWYMIYSTRPFEYIHMDFVKLPPSIHGYKYVLVITDSFVDPEKV